MKSIYFFLVTVLFFFSCKNHSLHDLEGSDAVFHIKEPTSDEKRRMTAIVRSQMQVGDRLEIRTKMFSPEVSYVFSCGLDGDLNKKDKIRLIGRRLSAVVSADEIEVNTRWKNFKKEKKTMPSI